MNVKDERFKNKMIKYSTVVVLLFALAGLSFFGYKTIVRDENVSYLETNNLNYIVCFIQPNDFYEEQCAPDTINSYVSTYIDEVNINLDYRLNLSRETEITARYSIMGEIVIFDRNNPNYIMNRRGYVLLEEQEISVVDSEYIEISELLVIDYQVHNEFVAEYKRNANVQAGAHLLVTMLIETGSYFYQSTEQNSLTNKMALTIPLDEPIIQIASVYQPNNSGYFEVQSNKTVLNYTLLVLAFIFVAAGGFLLFIIWTVAHKRYKSKPIYERFIAELKNNYDADITNLKSLIDSDKEDNYTYLDVASFKELYEEIRKGGGKQIYWNEKEYYGKKGGLKNRITWFFVFIDDNKVSRFVVDEKELTEKYEKDPDVLKEYRG